MSENDIDKGLSYFFMEDTLRQWLCVIASTTLPVLLMIGFVVFSPNQTRFRLEAGRTIRRPLLRGFGSREGEEWAVRMETGTALIYSCRDFWCLAPFLE